MNIAQEVVAKDLCISCGACEAICPHDAISMKFSEGCFRATIDSELCVDCGLCGRVCPSYQHDLSKYSQESIFCGEYLDCYIAHILDNTLREGGSSGGVVTGMITSLLREGHYKKAAVVSYDRLDEQCKQAEYTITDNELEVLHSAKSKYVPVSTREVLAYIKAGSKNGGYQPIIVVATPCQIYAIRNYCKVKRIDDTNILFLGLFCEHTLNYNIYNYYHHIYGSYDAMHFRSKYRKGWPGHTVLLRGDSKNIINRKVRMSLKPLFRQNRCRHCFDKLNCDADISFGDCYIKGEKSRGGRSSVIVRTARGREAFNSIKSVVSCQSCTIEAIIQSQRADALNIEYSRAMEANANIYSNAPYTPDIKLDTEREEREYASLRIGAKAQCKQDYMDIYIAIGGDSPLERIKRFFNR